MSVPNRHTNPLALASSWTATGGGHVHKDFPHSRDIVEGTRKLKDVMGWCKEAQVQHLVVYALSTENLKRSEDEVSYLLDLFREMSKELRDRKEDDMSVRFIGDLTRFPVDIQDSIRDMHAQENPNAPYHVWIAAPYGGRAELLDTVNRLAARGPGPYTEADIADSLWSTGMPDPDLIIRTGGDRRLSNFLPWQGVYAELFFVETLWPAFTKEDFSSVLAQYGERERRYGK